MEISWAACPLLPQTTTVTVSGLLDRSRRQKERAEKTENCRQLLSDLNIPVFTTSDCWVSYCHYQGSIFSKQWLPEGPDRINLMQVLMAAAIKKAYSGFQLAPHMLSITFFVLWWVCPFPTEIVAACDVSLKHLAIIISIGFAIREQISKLNTAKYGPTFHQWRHKCFHLGAMVTASVARCWRSDVMALSHCNVGNPLWRRTLMISSASYTKWPVPSVLHPRGILCRIHVELKALPLCISGTRSWKPRLFVKTLCEEMVWYLSVPDKLLRLLICDVKWSNLCGGMGVGFHGVYRLYISFSATTREAVVFGSKSNVYLAVHTPGQVLQKGFPADVAQPEPAV